MATSSGSRSCFARSTRRWRLAACSCCCRAVTIRTCRSRGTRICSARSRIAIPSFKLHALSPPEILHLSRLSQLPVPQIIERLIAAGLDSVPGGGAEILVDRVRHLLHCYGKASADEWLDVMRHAHRAGLRTTATMMYGTVETDEERLEHLLRLRALQDETGGFTAFITWSYQPDHTELSGTEATGIDYLRTLALSRIVLDNFDNLQASWVTQGGKVGQLSLAYGANDMGSVMIEENVVRAAGASYCMDEVEIVRNIEDAGFVAKRRDMHYRILGDPDLPRARRAADARARHGQGRRRRERAGGADELSRSQPRRQTASRRPALIRCHASWVLPIGAPPLRDGWVAIEDDRIVAYGSDAERGESSRGPRARHRSGRRGDSARTRQRAHASRAVVSARAGAGRPDVRVVDSSACWRRGATTRIRTPPRFSPVSTKGLRKRFAAAPRRSATSATRWRRVRRWRPALSTASCSTRSSGSIPTDPIALVDRALEAIRGATPGHGGRTSLAAHAPYSVAPAVLRAIAAAVERDGLPTCSVHLAESAEEVEFLRTGDGPWRELLEDLGVWNPAWVAPGVSPVQYLDDQGFLASRVHGRPRRADDRRRSRAARRAAHDARHLPEKQRLHRRRDARRSNSSTRRGSRWRSVRTAWPAPPT